MKNKFKFLIKQSLMKKIGTKWFKIANIIIAILLIGIFNIDKIITFFGGDFDNLTTIYVVDKLNVYDDFVSEFNKMALNLDMKDYKLEKSFKSEDEETSTLENELDKIVLVIDKENDNYLDGKIISYDEIGTITKQLINTSLNSLKTKIVIEENNLSEEEIVALTSPVNVEIKTLNPEKNDAENKEFISVGVMMIFILPCFLLITLLVQMIGAEVNDEKATKSMEIIISNVSPKVHFLAKIIASTLFVTIQGCLFILYALLAMLVRVIIGGSISLSLSSGELGEIISVVNELGITSLLVKGLPIIIILFIFSFISYAIISGVLASMTTSTEDFQQLQMPLMIILVLGYYLAMMATTFEGSLFIKVISFIPMLSFLISPTLFILGQVSLLELGIATAISGIFMFVIFKYGLRIYKVGILNYSSEKLWHKLFKSIKVKN